MNILVIIPARGGSKGIPHKNIKPFCGKPLIEYTIDVARKIVPDNQICVSTDDREIIKVVEDYGLKVPFVRPKELATDHSGTYEVLLHALKHYEDKGMHYDVVLLLQVTSPFRMERHVREALSMYTPDVDMVVSVKEATANPYYSLYEEDKDGYLQISKGDGTIVRRQDAPKVYEYNGAVYVINPESMKRCSLSLFKHCKKYVMDELSSFDLDTKYDWQMAEMLSGGGKFIIVRYNHLSKIAA